jgi:hypothetical protein
MNVEKQRLSLGTVSFVLSALAGLFILLVVIPGFVFHYINDANLALTYAVPLGLATAGLVLGIIGLRGSTGYRKTMAKAGLLIGLLVILAIVIFTAVFIWVWSTAKF